MSKLNENGRYASLPSIKVIHVINHVREISEGKYELTVGGKKGNGRLEYCERLNSVVSISELHPIGIGELLRGSSLYTVEEMVSIINDIELIQYKGEKGLRKGQVYLEDNDKVINDGVIGKVESILIEEGEEYYTLTLGIEEQRDEASGVLSGYKIENKGYKGLNLTEGVILVEEDMQGVIDKDIEAIIKDFEMDKEYLGYIKGEREGR